MTKDERRKFDFLLKKARISEKELNDRFSQIDSIMKNISVGTEVYEPDPFYGAFPQKVIEIVDADQGIVKLHEESINRTRVACILGYDLAVEEACKWCY